MTAKDDVNNVGAGRAAKGANPFIRTKKDSIVDTISAMEFCFIYEKCLYFRPLTAHFGGFEGIFSYKTDKSAILCPGKTEVADFVSFKGSIVQGMIFKHFDIPVAVEIRQNNRKASMC